MSQTIVPEALAWAAQTTNINANKVLNVCKLIFEQECTIPFIARYRKEVTGGMDEVQIRDIQNSYENYIELTKRKAYIIEQIKKQDKLTPELEKQILATNELNILEDIYAPYKAKKKTKAQIAKDWGLEPLAMWLMESNESLEELEKKLGTDYQKISEGKCKDFDAAITGACDILTEKFSHDLEVKDKLRQSYWRDGKMIAGKRKDAEKIKEYDKFRDFFEYTESLNDLKDPKASHRYLAMRRGMTLKVLKVECESMPEFGMGLIESKYFPKGEGLTHYGLLSKCAKRAYDASIHSSLDLEIKTDLKKIADEAAIDVFGVNLKNLLLQPYLGSKAVLGIDPGVRTGCKVVIVDETGAFKGDHVVYPFPPKNQVRETLEILSKMIELFNIEYIAIGNGTFGRETLAVCQALPAVSSGKVKATMINEAGASIYSASDIARKEFPDKDVTVRGAVSIARRFQDPLAELVKIDPKSIGVGQYQHDVNQVKLKKSLTAVVEDCVNYVGVDINTASAPLLSYISGIGPTVAANIVKHRSDKGKFKNRKELLKVSRLSEKVFEQCAGFLRIYDGDNPLDSTFIHPERYEIIEKWAKGNGITLADLVRNKVMTSKIAKDDNLNSEVGELTLVDIVKSLEAPTQDPRDEFKPIEFSKELKEIKDVKPGSWYTGVVTNIANFGAFVDIGIKENGLLHISQISNEFVENALEKLKVGEVVKVKILEVDMDRKRISLSMKSDSDVTYNKSKSGGKKKKQEPQIRNNAFAGLKNFKVK